MANWHPAQHDVYVGYNAAAPEPVLSQRQECDYCGAPGQLETCAYCSTPRGWRKTKKLRHVPRPQGVFVHTILSVEKGQTTHGTPVTRLRVRVGDAGFWHEQRLTISDLRAVQGAHGYGDFAGIDLSVGSRFWAKPAWREVQYHDGRTVMYYDVANVTPE